MQFKLITLKELETSRAFNILGVPTKFLATLEKDSEIESLELSESIIQASDVRLVQEETVQCSYDNNGIKKDVTGQGIISIINSSKKDRIWDSRLKLTENERLKIDCEKDLLIGNLEPGTRRSLQYNLIQPESLPDIVELTEEIGVVSSGLELVDISIEQFEPQQDKITDDENQEWRNNLLQEVRDKDIQLMIHQIIKLTELTEKQKVEQIEILAGSEKKIVRRLLDKKTKKSVKELKKLIREYEKINLTGRAKFFEHALEQSLFDFEITEPRINTSNDKQVEQEEDSPLDRKSEKVREQENLFRKEGLKLEKRKDKLKKQLEKLEKQKEGLKSLEEAQKQNENEKLGKTKNLEVLRKQNETKSRESFKKLEELQKEDDSLRDQLENLQKKTDKIKQEKIKTQKQQKEIQSQEETENADEISKQLVAIQKKLDKLLSQNKEIQNQKKALNTQVDQIKKQKGDLKKQEEQRTEEVKQREKNIKKLEDEIKKDEENIQKLKEKCSQKEVELKDQETDLKKQEETLQNQLDTLMTKEQKRIEKGKKKQEEAKRKRDEELKRQEEREVLINWYKKILIRFIKGKVKTPETELTELIDKFQTLNMDEHVQIVNQWLQVIINLEREADEWYFSLLLLIKNDAPLLNLLESSPNLGDYMKIVTLLTGKKSEDERISVHEKIQKNKNLLILGRENIVKFSFSVKNKTNSLIKDLLFSKRLPKQFFDLKFEKSLASIISVESNIITWTLEQLEPQAKADLTFVTKIKPYKKEVIGTGDIEVRCSIEDYLISGTQIEDFSAYSHARHIIKKKEKEEIPNRWQCFFVFINNSQYNMKLKSIFLLDKLKETVFLDLNSQSIAQTILKPGEVFKSNAWEVDNQTEPQFSRKVEYSVTHKIEKKSKYVIKREPDLFDLIDIQMKKTFSTTEIKSFEESELRNSIFIKNSANIPLYGLLIKEIVPADFIPPSDPSEFEVRVSSGLECSENCVFKIYPQDENPNHEHQLFILINLEQFTPDFIVNANEFVEIEYALSAITPNYKKTYQFPLEISSYYAPIKKFNNFQKVTYSLQKNEQPNLHIIHKRRNIEIGKEIYPGRSTDEFAVAILINNKSDVENTDITITDTIPKAFEVVSSNVEHEITESADVNLLNVSFNIDSIRPHQECEIRYYLRNKSGKRIDYAELESFIIG